MLASWELNCDRQSNFGIFLLPDLRQRRNRENLFSLRGATTAEQNEPHKFPERATDCARSFWGTGHSRATAMAKASELLREQAERCAQLANSATDESSARILRALAEDYWARADRLERRENAGTASLGIR